MSYQGFGYDFTVNLPVVGAQTISLPIEKLVNDAANMAVSAGWPPLQAKLEAEFPKLLQQGLAAGQKAVVNQLWPQIEPKLLADARTVVGEAEKVGYVIGGILIASIFGAAYWVKKGR
jgi:hypothetical protein